MNKYQFSFLFLFIPFFVFGQNFTKIIDFSITENLDSLGFKPQYIDQGEPYVPIAINCINDEIVILDSFNSRLVFYTLEGIYLREVRFVDFSYSFSPFFIIGSNRILFYTATRGCGIYQLDGQYLYSIPPNSLTRSVYSKRELYFLNDYLYAYSNNEWIVFKDNSSPLADTDEQLKVINDYETIENENFREYLQNVNVMVSAGIAISNNYQVFTNYSQTDVFQNLGDLKVTSIGTDDSGNRYWEAISTKGKYSIIITDNEGFVLNTFEVTENVCLYQKFIVSSSGDLYSIRIREDGISLWKTERNW